MRRLRGSTPVISGALKSVAFAGREGRQNRIPSIALVVLASLQAAMIVSSEVLSGGAHLGLTAALDHASSSLFYVFPNSLYEVFPYFQFDRLARYSAPVAEFVFFIAPLSYGAGLVFERLRLRVGYGLALILYLIFSLLVGVLTVIYIIEIA